MSRDEQMTDDEITLKDTVLLIQDYVTYLLRRALWIILAAAIGGAVMFWRARSTPDTYVADLTFMINEEKSNSVPGLGSVLGQLGLGGGDGGDNNLNKIVELSKSRRLVKNVLFDSIRLNDKVDLVANHLIREYDYHAKWADRKDPPLAGFLYDHNDTDTFDRRENEVLKTLHAHVVGSAAAGKAGLIVLEYAEDTGIMTISGRTNNETLSIALSSMLYDQLSVFYVNKSTERQRITLNRLTVLSDSVYQELNKVEYALTRYRDRSLQLIERSSLVAQNDLRRKQQVLNVMYAETLKNRETSSFMLSNATPFFQAIDLPIGPIKKNNKPVLRSLVIGALLGGILCIGLLIVLRVYRSIMNQP